MWTREMIKRNAKTVLRRTFWSALVVCLLAGLLGAGGSSGVGFGTAAGSVGAVEAKNYGVIGGGDGPIQFYAETPDGKYGITIPNGSYIPDDFDEFDDPDYFPENGIFDDPDNFTVPGGSDNFTVRGIFGNSGITASFPSKLISWILFGIGAAILIAVIIISLCWNIFIGGPIEVGRSYFFVDSRYHDADIKTMFRSFTSGRYMNIVGAMFLRKLYIFLWSLLFIIPGIVKSYQYRMVPYLLGQNPGMSASRAIELSRKMTDGEKGKIFVLDLSFIGWSLLAVLTCGIGFLALNPYMEATYGELFAALRVKAISQGFTTVEEIGEP